MTVSTVGVNHASQPRLRKDLLEALQVLLGDVRESNTSRLIFAKPPLQLPPGVSAAPLPEESLPEFALAEHYPLGLRWPEYRLHRAIIPYLGVVVKGEADIRIGFPKGDKIELNDCYVLRLPSPSFLLLPPGTAYAGGDQPPWERPHPELANSQILYAFFLPSEVLCHLHVMKNAFSESQLALQVKDKGLGDLWNLITEELTTRAPDSENITRTLLLALLMRLRRGIGQSSAKVAVGINSWLPASDIPSSRFQLPTHKVLRKACEYVQMNLHESLSPIIIARQVELTPTQLNRLFRAELGTTTMQYVTGQQLEAAKLYLNHHHLSVAEISQLFGYKHTAHFSRVFSSHVGMSPSEYRRRCKDNESISK